MEKGKAEGIQEGIERGKLETALNLINLGQPISIASKATGLPENMTFQAATKTRFLYRLFTS